MRHYRRNCSFDCTICPRGRKFTSQDIGDKALKKTKKTTPKRRQQFKNETTSVTDTGSKNGTNFGSKNGTSFWAQHIFRDLGKKLVPKMEPILVPIFGTTFGKKNGTTFGKKAKKKWNHCWSKNGTIFEPTMQTKLDTGWMKLCGWISIALSYRSPKWIARAF